MKLFCVDFRLIDPLLDCEMLWRVWVGQLSWRSGFMLL